MIMGLLFFFLFLFQHNNNNNYSPEKNPGAQAPAGRNRDCTLPGAAAQGRGVCSCQSRVAEEGAGRAAFAAADAGAGV